MKKANLEKNILIFVVVAIVIMICFLVANRQINNDQTYSGDEYIINQEEWLETVNGNIKLSERETLGESITVTVSLDKNENIDSVTLYALQDGIAETREEIEATKKDNGVYEAEVNFEKLNAEEGYYQFKAILKDNNGNEKEIISKDTVNYSKTGISYAHAYEKEDGRTAVQITALGKGEVLVSTTNVAPTADDTRWTKYEAGEEYIIATPEENVENVYVWYKNGEKIINAADSGISVMSFSNGLGILMQEKKASSYAFYTSVYNKYSKSDILTITLSKTNNAPADSKAHWDVSLNQDGSVNAYIYTSTEDSSKYDLYICGNGELIAPQDSSYLFRGYLRCKEINGLENLDVSNVTSMEEMFHNCREVKILELNSWNVSNVTIMKEMFEACYKLSSLVVNDWDVHNVTDMDSMFSYCRVLSNLESLKKWNVGNVKYMNSMFSYCISLYKTTDLSEWDVSNVINMDSMFAECSTLSNIDGLRKWDVSKVSSMYDMFIRCGSLSSTVALSDWNTKNVITMYGMFSQSRVSNLEGLSKWNVSNVKSMTYMFEECMLSNATCLSDWDVSSVTNMDYMFQNCRYLSNIDLSDWNVGNVKSMRQMFEGCTSLTNIGDISGWNVSNVTDMSYMFHRCKKMVFVNLGNWNISNVTDFEQMFRECTSLKYLLLGNNFDKIVSFKTSSSSSCAFAEANTAIITLREDPITFLIDSSYLSCVQNCPATLYVKNATVEKNFEAADTEGMFGPERIKEILELIGNSEITITTANKYIDPGVNVAGYPSKDLNSCKGLGLTFEANTSEVDTAIANKKPGEYTVRYTLKYNGEVFATKTRTVTVMEVYYKNDTNQYFTTLDDAFNGTATGGTITVLENVEDNTPATVPTDKTLTLELNGKTITTNDPVTFITNQGNLTIKDSKKAGGSIQSNSSTNMYLVYNVNTFTMDSGTLAMQPLTSEDKYPATLVIDQGGAAYINEGATISTNRMGGWMERMDN